MADKNELIYGSRNGEKSWMGKYINVFMDNDGHLGISCTNDGRIEVHHYMIKNVDMFHAFIGDMRRFVSNACNIDEAIENLEAFLDSEYADVYLDEYPEYEEPEMRSKEAISAYCDEAFDRVWLVRAQNNEHISHTFQPDIQEGRRKAIKKICREYNIDFDSPTSDWEYGYWSGILSALRWVLGDEKDFLDT